HPHPSHPTDNLKKHTAWICFGQNKLDDIVTYCTCKSGLRTADGTCSHITAVLIALYYRKNNKKISTFYATAAALFINVLNCTVYKQKDKSAQMLTYNDGTISHNDSQTSSSDQSTSAESSDEEATSFDTTDEDSSNAKSTDESFTNEYTNPHQCNLKKRSKFV
ncbi:unnamed protein product, partial [Rotaria sordida]